MSDALHRLAEHFGIASEYVDIWGNRHPAGDDTLRALLHAMRVDAHDDGAASAALAQAEATSWSEALPPVLVWRPGAPREVRIRRGPGAGKALSYRIEEENGGQHEGDLDTSTLTPVARLPVGEGEHVAYDVALPVTLPDGYHRLMLREGDATIATCVLIVAPAMCYQPPSLAGDGRVFGPCVQLYGVRSQHNWGIGDFTDLSGIVEQWGAQGAALVGVNPLHALFPHDPSRASPYSPSSRLFLNTLYIDVEAIADFGECEEARACVEQASFRAQLDELRAAGEVNYRGVAGAKREVLRILARHFRRHHLERSTSRAAAFRSFVLQGGEPLERLAIFEALQEHLHESDADVWGWPVWPEPYRDVNSAQVRQFTEEHTERIHEALYAQWQADLQLQGVADHARDLALDIGVYRDLAVSIDRGGAESWSNPALYGIASVGAPPDAFSPQGQNWGLPPMIPWALRKSAYASFIATLRANMRHAGALRIDHVMGLARLYWVPNGASAAQGAYVRYPLDDLMAVLALESQRQRCLIIGEDLGTVPDEIRSALRDANVLSYRLLWFERDDNGGFLPPQSYPPQALVAVTTHDLPTLAGWWLGRDIDARDERGLFAQADTAAREREHRAHDRIALLEALARAGIPTPEWRPGAPAPERVTPELARRIQQFLASSPAQVMVVQLEDVAGVEDQVNLPGTTGSYPNWQRKVPVALEQWMDDARFEALTRMLRRVRHGHATQHGQAPERIVRVPRATYRLQFHREFTLRDATALVPYLAALGVSHVYCSPYLRARPGSRHGYDIVDHAALNPEIGDTADLDAFVAALGQHGMSHILDMVPNHMGVMGSDNAWWMDVLENGPASIYADHFDIDWTTRDPDVGMRVLIPILGDHYGNVLERGELRLGFEAATGAFAVRYYTHRLPLDPRTYAPLLERARQCAGRLPPSTAARVSALLSGMQALPARHATSPGRMQARHEAKESLKAQLARIVSENPELGRGIEVALHEWNGAPGDAQSMSALHDLLEAQAFRVAFWRVASDEINYRRFFDVNDLAALRVENDTVFDETHRFVMSLAVAGKVDGLRIDHPDGLYDPARYFERLQEYYAHASGRAKDPAHDRPLYVVIEKILASHEELPMTWAIHGTTGYRFANLVNGLFVDAAAKGRVDRAWRAFVRDEAVDFDTAANQGKRAVMQGTLAAELNVLTRRLLQIARADRHTRDFTFNVLRQALIEVTAAFPVYRTYVSDRVGPHDRRHIEWAVARARRRSRAADVSVFDFVRSVLLVRPPAHAGEVLQGAYRAFAMRFQQFTAPVTAKGVEDTALYVFNRLLSLNEVGGDPDRFGTSVSAFHAANAHRAQHWPHTLIASSTHDNKRSEDVRARIDLISEMPGAWRFLTRRWSRLNRSKKRMHEGEPAPSRNDEYLLYQTLVGSFPLDQDDATLGRYSDRVKAYAIKAAREAKISTSWINVNAEYETALSDFVDRLLASGERNLFLEDFFGQRAFLSWFGSLNSIAMAGLKLTSPGVPDIYQGNEVLDFSLVDPDNRRAVDYDTRRGQLESLQRMMEETPRAALAASVRALLEHQDGRAKLWVTWRGLQLRAQLAALFRDGDYTALRVEGSRAGHVVAFTRKHQDAQCVVVSGRLFALLADKPGTLPDAAVWDDTSVVLQDSALHRYVDTLTGREIAPRNGHITLADVLTHFPIAFLVPEHTAVR